MTPEGMRSRIDESAGELRITIPARWDRPAAVVLGFWLFCWAIGEFFAARAVLGFGGAPPVPVRLLLLIWLCAWTIGGAGAAYIWIWSMAGREIVTVTGTTLSIERAPIPLPTRREFDGSSVRNLRVSRTFHSRGDTLRERSGSVAFECGARTVRFGDELDEAEAAVLVEAILRRFPEASA